MRTLSVVIPTYGRSHLVAALLVSIAADVASLDGETEVLVVDDSPPDEAVRIARAAAAYGATMLRSPTANVGGKRNFGVQQAKHAFVLFLDSDVEIQRGTLRAHYDRLADAPDDIAGCLGKVVFVGSQTLAWKVMEAMQLTLPFAYPDIVDRVPWGPTANLSVRRDAFLEIGGFDDESLRYGGEDVDLGLRWHAAGKHILTAPEAIAEHSIETWSTWRQNFSRLWSFGSADYYLLVRHPERIFVDIPTAPMLWLAELAVALAFAIGGDAFQLAGAAMVLSMLAYPLVYALVKRKKGSSVLVHFLGPIIFWTMDLAKTVKAVRNRRLDLIFKRLLFLDDLIAQDWREIAASMWGLTASVLTFASILLVGPSLAFK